MALVLNGTVLIPGRHTANISEVEDLFVNQAPFSSDRYRTFSALTLFIGELKRSLPGTTKIWVNGGFVTHKPWAPPADVDVAFPVVAAEWVSLSSRRRLELQSWFLPSGEKVQPMGGLIDGFAFDPNSPAEVAYWDDLWSRVTDSAKQEILGAVKGYVEVAI